MSLNIYKADKYRQKWSIRGKLCDGDFVKIPGHRDRKIAEHMMRCIESLNRSKMLGELPDPNLSSWIDGLPSTDAERLIRMGLLPRRLIDKQRPLVDLLEEFETHLVGKCEDGAIWPVATVKQVRRLLEAIGSNIKFEALNDDAVNLALKELYVVKGKRKGQPIAQKTKREYIFSIKLFCQWLVKKRGVTTNPLDELVAPSAKGAPVVNRRPLRVADFQKLTTFLRSPASKNFHQVLNCTPEDRLMTYWMAVKTGFRAKELRSLTLASVDFEAAPVLITVEGWVAKNRTKATVPITDSVFAKALKKYVSRRPSGGPLLNMPPLTNLTKMLYRDLDDAGIRRRFDNGAKVDFHTFRSTSMYWWLTVDRFDLLEVQFRARLKTLSLIQEYVRNHVPEYLESRRLIPANSFAGRNTA